MNTWEQVILGIAAIVILFFFGPAANNAIKNSRKGTRSDWMGALIPIGFVVLFIIALIIIKMK